MRRSAWMGLVALVPLVLACSSDDGPPADAGADPAADSVTLDLETPPDAVTPDAATCAASGDSCERLPCCEGSACDPGTLSCVAGLECVTGDCQLDGTPCCGPMVCIITGGAGLTACRDERGCIPSGGDCSQGGNCCGGDACAGDTCQPTP